VRRLAVVVLVMALIAMVASTATAVDATSVPSIPCPGPSPSALTPEQALARYDLQPLRDAGFTGQGVRVALVELGTSVNEDYLTAYEQCLHIAPVPFSANVVPEQHPAPTPPPAGGESMSDAEMIVGLAPGLERLTEFYNADGNALEETLRAALSPEGNGGRRPDIVSISFNTCEEEIGANQEKSKRAIDRMEVMLQHAAEAGTWVVKGAGDSGSSACAPHGPDEQGTACQVDPPQPLAVDYPASSPWVIAIGGVEVPADRGPLEPATQDRVWKQFCAGGGGGLSKYLSAPPWQATVPPGRPGDPMRMVPDIASLAGNPGYWFFLPPQQGESDWNWRGVEGDSMTGPLHSAAFAMVRSALAHEGIQPPALLTPVLYELANDPATYARVFQDVIDGNDHVFNDSCCEARPGYDLTTGLGQLDFTALTQALIARAQPAATPTEAPAVVPTFTG
jgi:kumamolisin